MTKFMIIMRGISGCGKSTLAHEIANNNNGIVFSTDDYFGQGNDYITNFSDEKLPEAHAWNIENVKKAIERGVDFIIIDNTNIKSYAPKPYVLLADEFGYEVSIVEPDSYTWNVIKTHLNALTEAVKSITCKNQHGVPFGTVFDMAVNYKPYSVDDIRSSVAPWEVPVSNLT